MIKRCPFFGKCGGCKYDFADAGYRAKKLSDLRAVSPTDDAIWCDAGLRRRADFAFAGGQIGFFETGTKNIVPITECPNLAPEINAILPYLRALPWNGAGGCLVTLCDNGIDLCITSDVPYFSTEFRNAIQKVPVLRATWNGKVVFAYGEPFVSFGGQAVPYISGAFLQPTVSGADIMRQLVADATVGTKRVADLFCGLGNFTFATGADGFDVVGVGVKRDLFKNPLTAGMLKQYDCVIMDPPRAGALAQSKILAGSDVARIVYISCNPATFVRDVAILTRGGYKLKKLIPIDQFVGSAHWELFSIFEK